MVALRRSPLTTSTQSAGRRVRRAEPFGSSAAGTMRRLRTHWLGTTALVGIGVLGLAIPRPSLANPTGGHVVTGSAQIIDVNGQLLDVTQKSGYAVIDWGSFSIGSGQTTAFFQPGSDAFTLNRVLGSDPSIIAGNLDANGNVILVNQSGILFSKGSQIDVGGLIATTSDIANQSFMKGALDFDMAPRNPGAMVVNQGNISVRQAGFAALVAPGVANSGTITAKLGKVVLAGAETYTLDPYGDGLISFNVTSQVSRVPASVNGQPATALVSNTGQITADGGHILLTADAMGGIINDLVDAGGTLQAQSVGAQTGKVDISALGSGTVAVNGAIKVDGDQPGQVGGTVKVTGRNVVVGSTARITTTGTNGGGKVEIGGGLHGGDSSLANALTTSVDTGATINASALSFGNGGTVSIWSTDTTSFAGTVFVNGGSAYGNGGYVETSGHNLLATGGFVDALSPHGQAGTWLLDPENITIATGGTDGLNQGFTTNPSASVTIDPGTINTAEANIFLQANNNITVQNAVDIATKGVGLEIEAGKSILINADITLNDGYFVGIFCGPEAEKADRSQGQGVFSMSQGTSITTGGGYVDISLGDTAGIFGGGGTANVGDMTIASINTLGSLNGTILINDNPANISGAAGNLFVTGNVTSGGDVAFSSVGTATLDGTVNAGANNIFIYGNSIVENTGASISAAGLLLSSNASETMQQENDVGILASYNLGPGIFTNTGSFSIGNVSVTVSIFGNQPQTLSGRGLTYSGNFQIESANDIDVDSPIADSLKGGTFELDAGRSIVLNSSISTTDGNVSVYANDPNAPFLTSRAPGQAELLMSNGSEITTDGGNALLVMWTYGGGGPSFAGNMTIGTIDTMSSAATSGGSVTIYDNLGVDEGSIFLNGPITAGADSAFYAATVLTIDGKVDVGSNDVYLQSGGLLNETGNGAVSAGGLLSFSTGITDLQGANAVGVLAATSLQGLAFNDTVALTIGNLTFSGQTGSGVSAGGDAALVAGGTLTLAGPVAVGQHNLRLDASAGDIIEDTGGTITAAGLVAQSAGMIALLETNQVGVLAASASGDNASYGDIAFNNGEALTIGSVKVAPPSLGASLTGLQAGFDSELLADGTLTLTASVSVGDRYLRLETASGDIVEAKGGTITAGGLLVQSAGMIDLQGGNQVEGLAAQSGTGLAFNNLPVLSIDPEDVYGATMNGIAAGADSAIVSEGVYLQAPVDVRGHNLELVAKSPSYYVEEAAGGAITAAGLLVQSAGMIDLAGANAVGVLAASASGNSSIGSFVFNDGQPLTIGSVAVGSPSLGTKLSGITAVGDSAVVADGTLTLASSVNLAGHNLLLDTRSGNINQGNEGYITAAGLVAESAGTIDLQAANEIDTFAANSTGGLAFNNGQALTVGSVTVGSPSLGTTLSGITAGADSALVVDGTLTLAARLDGGSNLRLETLAGDIVEGTGDVIIARSLIVDAAGAVDLMQANQVETLAGRANTGFAFYDSGPSLALTTLSVRSPGLGGTADGVQSTTGSVLVDAPYGKIQLAANVSAATDIALSGGSIAEPAQTAVMLNAPISILDVSGSVYSPSQPPPALLAGDTLQAYLQAYAVSLPQNTPKPPNATISLPDLRTSGNSQSLVLVESGATMTGNLTVGNLGLISLGSNPGSANLSGSVQGDSSQDAAMLGRVYILSDGATMNPGFLFNSCPLGSVACSDVVTTIAPVPPLVALGEPTLPSETLRPLIAGRPTDDLRSKRREVDDVDVERVNTGREDEE